MEIVQNNNVSLFGVHIGMEKDVALSVLKNYKTTIGGNVIGISSNFRVKLQVKQLSLLFKYLIITKFWI